MAAVNFPDPLVQNPATGEPYANGWYNDPATGGNGVTYEYTNGVWSAVTSPSDALDDRYVEVAGDTMTGALSINDEIILNPDGSADFSGAITADSGAFAGDVQMASQNGGQLAGFRNQIINGDFRIWQRSDSQAEVGFASVDRWRSNSSRQINYSDQVKPEQFARSIRGAVANEVLSIRHPIELFSDTGVTSSAPFYSGSQWTLSWWVKCDDNTAGSVNTKLTWSNNSSTLGTAASQVVDVPFDGDWKQYSTTFTIQSQASNTDTCLLVSIAVTPSSTGKAVLTGVQLEPGPVATPFEHRPIGTELALCQRYFNNVYRQGYFYRASSTATYGLIHLSFPQMRIIPTVAKRAGSPDSVTFQQVTASGFTLALDIGNSVDEYVFDVSMNLDAEL